MIHTIEWGVLAAIEPRPDEVAVVAAQLADAYNDPHNAKLLGHTQAIAIADVLEHYANLAASGAHPFLLFDDGALAGDGDLRGLDGGVAEFAFLIAKPSAQGKGLGTRFATMIHAYAFATLGLERLYATVIPENVASLRVFEKLGYITDDSDAARAYADEGDVTLRVDRAGFVKQHAAALAEIRIAVR
jgi:RimJ/RimL family protein N-acetyltransferase